MYNRLIAIYIFLIGFFTPGLTYSQPKYEIRATWLTTLGGLDWPSQKATSAKSIERQKQELCEILDALKRANFNTVLLQTRLRGDVIYPSAIEPFTESLTGHEGGDPHYDPLKFAIDECHRRGMELHAWIVTIPIGNTRQVKLLGKNQLPKNSRLFANYTREHGIWIREICKPTTIWQASYTKLYRGMM